VDGKPSNLQAATKSSPDIDVEFSHQLIASCQGLVRSIAWKIHRKLPRQVEIDDLIAYGQVGLTQAATKFDRGRRNEFNTYAFYRVRGAIFDGLKQMSWFKLRDYDASTYEYEAEEQEAHAANASNLSRGGNEAGWLGSVSKHLSVNSLTDAADDSFGADLADERSPSPAVSASNRELRQSLARLLEELPPDAKALIRATYFEGVTLTEAGRRLNLSKAWASRLQARALQRLERGLRLAGEFD
jgi:RNA polymerase sigma factor for flagellar operon FliA